MSTSAIKVVLRTRPTDATFESSLQFPPDRKTVVISVPSKGGNLPTSVGPTVQQYQFKFDNVLHNASQEDMFEACATEALQNAWSGINSTIMCYGQTGAGKTFTMTGGRHSFGQRGLVPRVLSQLFQDVRARQDRVVTVQVSYLEIYNELLFDLLELTTQPQEVTVHEDGRGRVRLQGLRSCQVTSEAQALQLLFEGETNRVIGEHQLNRESSRSHSIFTITLRSAPAPGSEDYGSPEAATSAKLHLVDLAGSERVSKTKSDGQLLREAGHINKSLSILEQVIMALGERGREHVPYRSSKLTHVLRDSLGGNCATTLVANVWADPAQLEETLSTCRFAQRMTRVTCEITANVVQDSSGRARQLEREVAELRQELALHDSLAGRADVQYSPYSAAQRMHLRGQVLRFLQAADGEDGTGTAGGGLGSIEPLQLLSVRHMLEVLVQCRALYREAAAGSTGGGTAAAAGALARREGGSVASSFGGHRQGAGLVGDVEEDDASQSGGAGVAPDDCRPGSAPGDAGPAASTSGRSTAPSGNNTGVGVLGGGRDAAWETYKGGEGRALAEVLTQNKLKLAQLKRTAKVRAVGINGIKRQLDEQLALAQQLREQRQHQQRQERPGDDEDSSEEAAAAGRGQQEQQEQEEREGGGGMMGPEELAAVQAVQQLKAQYRDQYNELQMLRSEVAYTQELADQCGAQLLLQFEAWLASVQAAEQAPAEAPSSPSGGQHSAGHSPKASKQSAGALGAAKPSSEVREIGNGVLLSRAPNAPQADEPGRWLATQVDIDYGSMAPEAAAYVKAQQALYQRLHGPGPAPGAIKAQRQKAGSYFGITKRSDLNDKLARMQRQVCGGVDRQL